MKEIDLRYPELFLFSKSNNINPFKYHIKLILPLVKVNKSSSFFADFCVWSDHTLRIHGVFPMNVICSYFGPLHRRITRGDDFVPSRKRSSSSELEEPEFLTLPSLIRLQTNRSCEEFRVTFAEICKLHCLILTFFVIGRSLVCV